MLTVHRSADRFQYLIRAGVGWVSLANLPCLYASVSMLFGPRAVCLASLYRFHAVRAACKPFSVLPSCSARFINGTTSLCITESGPTSLKSGGPFTYWSSLQSVHNIYTVQVGRVIAVSG